MKTNIKTTKKKNNIRKIKEKAKSYEGVRMLNKAQELNTSWAYDMGSPSIDKQLLLLDNVQFIYELALAQLELRALKIDFEVTNGLREFKLVYSEDEDIIKKRTAYFKVVKGEYTDYFKIIQKNRTRSVNQYLTHWIYPYKGKFHPQMIRALMNVIGLERGETVLDPFVGSGTAAVEAQLLGINFIGTDVSPLCILQSKVKTESLEVLPSILKYKEKVASGIKLSHPAEKIALDKAIDSISIEKVKNFYQMVKLVAISDTERRRREFFGSFFKNIELMISSVQDYVQIVNELKLKLGKVDIKEGDSRALSLKDESIDGIVTSPPYSIALDYVANDSHALKELGFDLSKIKEEFIGVRGTGPTKINLYDDDLAKSIREMYRVLKRNKYAVIVIGNATYQGQEVRTVEFTINYAEKIGFRLIKNIDKIIFGLYNVMLKENILIFQKS